MQTSIEALLLTYSIPPHLQIPSRRDLELNSGRLIVRTAAPVVIGCQRAVATSLELNEFAATQSSERFARSMRRTSIVPYEHRTSIVPERSSCAALPDAYSTCLPY